MTAPIIYSPSCLQFEREGHPESPARVEAAKNFLEEKEYPFLMPDQSLEENVLRLVHKQELIERVKAKQFQDPDTPRYENIFDFALLAVQAAITAQKNNALSLLRPPGHHAGRNFLGGFCYFNNLALAVKRSEKKILIVDIDGHHGNGTQDVFFNDKQVTYLSLHCSPLFPQTGFSSKANCHNYPLSADCGEEKYLKILKTALDGIERESYEQLAISAGFDTYQGDLASLGLENQSFRRIGHMLAKLELPTFAVLEGGYTEQLGEQIDQLLAGLDQG